MALITCRECGSQVSSHALNCPKCGAPIAPQLSQNASAPQSPQQPAAPVASSRNNVAAGLLAIFLGCLGIHYFYLGKQKAGITFLLIGLLGWILFAIPVIVIAIISLVSGIKMLTMSEAEFQRNYVTTPREFPI